MAFASPRRPKSRIPKPFGFSLKPASVTESARKRFGALGKGQGQPSCSTPRPGISRYSSSPNLPLDCSGESVVSLSSLPEEDSVVVTQEDLDLHDEYLMSELIRINSAKLRENVEMLVDKDLQDLALALTNIKAEYHKEQKEVKELELLVKELKSAKHEGLLNNNSKAKFQSSLGRLASGIKNCGDHLRATSDTSDFIKYLPNAENVPEIPAGNPGEELFAKKADELLRSYEDLEESFQRSMKVAKEIDDLTIRIKSLSY